MILYEHISSRLEVVLECAKVFRVLSINGHAAPDAIWLNLQRSKTTQPEFGEQTQGPLGSPKEALRIACRCGLFVVSEGERTQTHHLGQGT